jgi:3-methyladenine DNA glycosylase AlkC
MFVKVPWSFSLRTKDLLCLAQITVSQVAASAKSDTFVRFDVPQSLDVLRAEDIEFFSWIPSEFCSATL